MNSVLFFALVAHLFGVSQPNEPAKIRLEPLSDWSVKKVRYGCAVQRTFGSNEKPTVLELRRDEPMNGGFDVAITSDEFELVGEPFSATFKPNGLEFSPSLPGKERTNSGSIWTYWAHNISEASSQNFTDEEFDRYLKEDGPEAFRDKIETLEIEGLFGRDLILQTGPISVPRQLLEDCYHQVMIDHGMPLKDAMEDLRPIEFRNRIKVLRSMLPLLPSPLVERLRAKKQVSVNFAIFLDSDAKPTGCRLTSSPRYSGLEQEGCSALVDDGRFRFKRGEEPRPTMVQAGYLYREDIGFAFTGG